MLSVIIPAYNEEETIEKTLQDVRKTMKGTGIRHEIIVVNDGSTDKTANVVKKDGKARLIENSNNKGYGASLKRGIKEARYGKILIMDADGTYPPEEIPALLKHVNDNQMVVGSRTGSKVHIPLYRRPAKWFLSRIANYLSGFTIPDLNSGMRIFDKDKAERFFGILPSGFSFTTTLTLAFLSSDYDVKYVHINYLERKGKSKIRPFRDGFNFITLIIRAVTYFKPLKVFMPIAFSLFVVGIVLLCTQIILTRNITEASVLFILVAFQIGFLGLIADLIAKKSGD